MTSTVGSEPSMIWPDVLRGSPDARALRRRISSGSTPSSTASRSICDSAAKLTCTTPKPRMAPAGGLLVLAAAASTKTLSQRYGPTVKNAALDNTGLDVWAYAPPSRIKRASTLTRRPSSVASCRYHIRAGCRWT